MGRLPPSYRLSAHFHLYEFTRSDLAARTGIDNYPTDRQLAEMVRVAEWLEIIRAQEGPIYVSSGLRVPALNAIVPGSSKTSAHQYGRAADWSPYSVLRKKVRLADVFARVLAMPPPPFDQLLYEYTWIHVGFPTVGRNGRGMVRMKFPGGSFEKWRSDDPRLR